ncbi:hypothetical protein TTHERM_000011798 (macronuclear) [Tetrahymena thermophila SB210]|uniref:Uncharacterized protein n=1 Tax=Tetrahymena thermophila (strain SB210) TaxID=312017 RepID=W7XKA7_TETTS|nr:hypothetical protein TTHERM_000011798 [Tetrahymena thermophila SB210]EWS76341.1 hypothetical protein TTHERM_000011798 [Tetrahymena thermophila SB210]|eukprot:XP_012651125.1 hypothetical protein TTHERM_000011798 [Tetrahymena thermophila SB210]
MGKEMLEEGVSNNKQMRGISDTLDSRYWKGGYKSKSVTRAAVHGVYHAGVGICKLYHGNAKGFHAELCRAGEQFAKMGVNILNDLNNKEYIEEVIEDYL